MSISCTGLTGGELTYCNTFAFQTNLLSFPCTGELAFANSFQNLTTGETVTTCGTYPSLTQKSFFLVGNTGGFGNSEQIDTGNVAWTLLAAALVFVMTPAVGLFYAGLAGEETASNTLMMSFACVSIVTIQWWLFGFSFSFGYGTPGMGDFEWGALTNIPYGLPSGTYGFSITAMSVAAFQLMFAIITPSLIIGSVIGRMKFVSFLVFVCIWTTVIYDVIAHWVWSYTLVNDNGTASDVSWGWLGALGAIDFAGGTVIHISSGSAGLAAAIVLGKRHNSKEEVKPHNVPMVVLGASLLWFGWFGFNPGSALGAGNAGGIALGSYGNGLASFAFLNTHFATSMSTISWMVTERIFAKKITATGASAGAVAGLVAITPASGYIPVWASILVGLFVSPICYGCVKLRALTSVDDTLDSFAIHAVGGAVGAFMTGIFASETVNGYSGAAFGHSVQLGYQMSAICASASFSFCGTILIMLLLKYTIGIRVDEQTEKEGIDLSEHGAKTYAQDAV